MRHNFSVTIESRIAFSIDAESGIEARRRTDEFVQQIRQLAIKSGYLLEMETPSISITDNDEQPSTYLGGGRRVY